MEVNGHKLPPLLVKLIEDGKWTTEKGIKGKILTEMLDTPAKLPKGFAMCVPEGMSQLVGDEFDWMAKADGLASSTRADQIIDDFSLLDIDKAVLIAMEWMDEYYICLDYRDISTKPRVVISVQDAKGTITWHIIAPDFEAFARKIGLIE